MIYICKIYIYIYNIYICTLRNFEFANMDSLPSFAETFALFHFFTVEHTITGERFNFGLSRKTTKHVSKSMDMLVTPTSIYMKRNKSVKISTMMGFMEEVQKVKTAKESTYLIVHRENHLEENHSNAMTRKGFSNKSMSRLKSKLFLRERITFVNYMTLRREMLGSFTVKGKRLVNFLPSIKEVTMMKSSDRMRFILYIYIIIYIYICR